MQPTNLFPPKLEGIPTTGQLSTSTEHLARMLPHAISPAAQGVDKGDKKG